ncbi:MAG TPA: phosphatase PAP2 family protein [Alphaproteobacteria bacterium]|nr:phosphatase PAP2 family protein [Alphaproteobacteria bacterium]
MNFDRAQRDILVMFGLLVVALYALALVLSHGFLAWGSVVADYASGTVKVAGVSVLILVIWHMVAAMRAKTPSLPKVRLVLADSALWTWLAVPALMAPVFFASFTIMKTLIGLRLGFGWDAFFTDLDAAIFGTDPWRLTHAVFGPLGTRALEYLYVGWGVVLVFSMTLVPIFAKRAHSARFLLAMFLVWPVTGLLLAAVFASAGPCFAYLFHPELAARFQPLQDSLAQLLPGNDLIRLSQMYLAKYWDYSEAVKGGGISAFPSVHVSVAVLYVFASWRILALRLAAIGFALAIWLGSIHFGYHYAVDGLAALVIVPLCWFAAGRALALVAGRHRLPDALGAAPAPVKSSAV